MRTKPTRLAAFVFLAFLPACKPTPEKSCARAAELSPSIVETKCVTNLTAMRETSPASFEKTCKCIGDAKNAASVNACMDEIEAQARITAQQAQQRALEDEKKKLEAQSKEQAAKIDNLLQQLAGAKDEATRLALQKQLEEERVKQFAIRRGGATKPP